MKYSFIIPVYNTPQKYLANIFSDIAKQAMSDYEIIVIDDGSDDDIAQFLDETSLKSDCMKVYHQKNCGVSAARNKGILCSTGDYVTFVDADDHLHKDFIKEAEAYCNHYKPDIIYGQIMYDTDANGRKNEKEHEVLYFDSNEKTGALSLAFKSIKRRSGARITGTPCAALYKRELLEVVQFPEGMAYYEDAFFNFEAVKKASSVLVVSNTWYIYQMNSFSATSRLKDKQYNKKMVPFMKKFHEFILSLDEKQQEEAYLYSLTLLFSILSKCVKGKEITKKEFMILFDELLTNELMKEMDKKLKFNYRCFDIDDSIKYVLLKTRSYKLMMLGLGVRR